MMRILARSDLRILALVVSLTVFGANAAQTSEPGRPADSPAPSDALLQAAVTDSRVLVEALRREVEVELLHARQSAAQDPVAAQTELKILLHQVIRAPELRSDERAALRDQIERALRECSRQQREQENRLIERQQAVAAQEARTRVLDSLDRQQEQLRQLSERVESLLLENRWELAEQTADALQSSADGAAQLAGLKENLRIAKATRDNDAARDARQRGAVNTLAQVEQAAVGIVDDEPIRYLPALEWQELTARRVKYARTDLHQSSAAEKAISRQLAEPTHCDLVEISLKDAVDYLQDLHGIQIQIDDRALEEAGMASDALVTLRVKRISLRSALRLLLTPLDLTYSVQNEVLLITTDRQASLHLLTKVYPVEQLVLPIRPPAFSGGFGGLGGFNNGGSQGQGNQGNNQSNPFNQQGNHGQMPNFF